MSAFTVTVRTARGIITYPAIARHSVDLIDAAIDVHGVCAISVIRMGG